MPTRRWVKQPGDLDLWPFDLESGARVTCDVSYLHANFGLPRHLCSRLRPDVCDRQTDRRQTKALLNAPPIRGRGIIIIIITISVSSSQLLWSRLVHSMRQLVSIWRISGEGSPTTQVMREKVPSCSKGYLLSFSDLTLFCSVTVLSRQTTLTNGHSSIYIFLTNFLFPRPRYQRCLGQ